MSKRKKRRIKNPLRFAVGVALIVLIVLLLAFLIAAVSGCFRSAPAPSSEATAAPTAASTPVQTPSLMPSPSPTPEPSWEERRLIEIEHYVRAYGNCPDEAAVEARMATMAIDPDSKMVAFTFDDGPRDRITDYVLDVCEQYGVRATFFINGENIDAHEEQLMRMLSLGCEIGNHTWEHTNVEELSAEEMRREIGSVNEAVFNRFGYTIHLFRPPYIKYGGKGSETRNTLIALMNEWDMAVVNHTRSTHDTYDSYTAEKIYRRGVAETDESNKPLSGAIVLCHDKAKKTAEAFGKIVPELLSRGYQLVTVSELLHYSDDGFHAGWIYSSAN
ncbi:MAG: polysaccharide deacetylase family protein [Clostridia bacterium]|nr:polysaccharide deacetylase family protein [Clostridia bacterium]